MKLKSLFIATALFSAAAHAQWSAGVATIASSTPYKGLSSESIVVPIVAYEGERLIWRGPALQYKLTGLKRNEPSLRVSVDLAPNALDIDETDELEGIERRSLSFLAGFRYIYPTPIGEFSAVIQNDVSSKHNGQRGALNFQRVLGNAQDRSWVITGGVQVEYLSDKYADYYFGVSQSEANNSIFEEYEVGAVWQAGLRLGGFYRFAENWQITAQSRWLNLADDVRDSPIVDGSNTLDGFLSVTYQF
jgi:outer membrane protein